MKTYRTEQIRNVGLFGHGGAGKTSLAEAMLYGSGTINRLGRVEEGNTVSDFDPDETRRHISINLSLLPLEWRDSKINLIDTPGYSDFSGEVKEGMRVVDGAVLLVDAVSGLELGTELDWNYASERNLPRFIVASRMDRENADFYRTLEQAQNRFGRACVAIQLPIGAQSDFSGVVDLVRMRAIIGPQAEERDIPAGLQEQAVSYREKLVEAAAETDDELINKYLEGETLTEDEVRRALRSAVISGQVVPVLAGAGTATVAVRPLLDAIVDYFPSPAEAGKVKVTNLANHQEEELDPLETAPLAALIFKTTADPYVGKLTYIRVFSGTLSSDSHVWNSSRSHDERIGQLLLIRGKSQEPIQRLVAGDIGAVAKLTETSTGDTLCSRDRAVRLSGIQFPAPVFSVSVQPKTKADLDKLGSSLARIVEEDATLQVRRDADTNETVLSGMGESHVEVAVEKMRRKFGVDILTGVPKVPYKETITRQIQSEFKHKKQTGGHGQYGHVFLELEPMPRGSGIEFAERVVGGVVPKNYIPAVEKGVNEAVQEGILGHFPVVDTRVILFDGSYHPVDSSEMSFKIASIQAFKKGMEKAGPVLLEPVMNVRVNIPDQFVGDIMGDLNSKRGRVQGMVPQDGTTVIEAQVPLSEMLRYATDLRSLTQGRGLYTMEFSHYEEVPAHIAQGVIEAAKKEREKE